MKQYTVEIKTDNIEVAEFFERILNSAKMSPAVRLKAAWVSDIILTDEVVTSEVSSL